MKINIIHYRIPMMFGKFKKRGKPESRLLMRYLRSAGFFYTVANERVLVAVRPYTKGGKTVCEIIASDGTVFSSEAICSMADNFSYSIGRKIAIGRAMKAYSEYIKKGE